MMRYIISTNQVEFDSSNPNNIVSAPVGAYFFRDHKTYYISFGGDITQRGIPSRSFGLENQYRIWFPTITEANITFANPYELWYKTSDNGGDTGWIFVGYTTLSTNFNLLTPTPTQTPTYVNDDVDGGNVFAGGFGTDRDGGGAIDVGYGLSIDGGAA